MEAVYRRIYRRIKPCNLPTDGSVGKWAESIKLKFQIPPFFSPTQHIVSSPTTRLQNTLLRAICATVPPLPSPLLTTQNSISPISFFQFPTHSIALRLRIAKCEVPCLRVRSAHCECVSAAVSSPLPASPVRDRRVGSGSLPSRF